MKYRCTECAQPYRSSPCGYPSVETGPENLPTLVLLVVHEDAHELAPALAEFFEELATDNDPDALAQGMDAIKLALRRIE